MSGKVAKGSKSVAAANQAPVIEEHVSDDAEIQVPTPKAAKPKPTPKAKKPKVEEEVEETDEEDEPVNVAKPKVKKVKEVKEKEEVKEKRTRAPSAFNLYMKARLAEMKLDTDIMEATPDHRDRFKQAAAEWSAMTDEEKVTKKAEFTV